MTKSMNCIHGSVYRNLTGSWKCHCFLALFIQYSCNVLSVSRMSLIGTFRFFFMPSLTFCNVFLLFLLVVICIFVDITFRHWHLLGLALCACLKSEHLVPWWLLHAHTSSSRPSIIFVLTCHDSNRSWFLIELPCWQNDRLGVLKVSDLTLGPFVSGTVSYDCN